MSSFDDFKIATPLRNAVVDLGFYSPTPIQAKAFPVVMSGGDMVGIAQTGTGKTFAYMLPILQMLPFSKEKHPRVLVLVPTRELVVQLVDEIEKFSKYTTLTTIGVYGGTNMNRQKEALAEGADYRKDPDGLQKWESKYKVAVNDLQTADDNSMFSGGALRVRSV